MRTTSRGWVLGVLVSASASASACADDGAMGDGGSLGGSSGADGVTATAPTGRAEAGDTSDDGATPDPSTGEGATTEGPGADDSGSSGEEAPPDGVPMFVALGQGGRRLLSCDDGLSWIAEQIVEDDNDDHGPYTSRALTWGEGTFVIGMGWGNPGLLWRTEDGLEWEQTFPPADHTPTGLSGVVYGAGRFVAVEGRRTWHSEDRGMTWARGDDLLPGAIIRTVGYSAYGGGHYYAVGDGEIHVSSDGETWSTPSSVQGSCDGNVTRRGGVVDDEGLFLVVTDTGNVCRSDDGGDTFTHYLVGDGDGTPVSSNIVVTELGFYAAGGAGAWSSEDGTEWESHAFDLDGDRIRRLARSDTGALVGIAWNGDDFYRSEDGLSWVRIDDAPPGNDVNRVTFGYATPSDVCPE